MSKYCSNCGAEMNGTKCEKCGKISAEATVGNVINKVKSYDYKSKTEELKTKATDITEKVKSYDYQEKLNNVKKNKHSIKKILCFVLAFVILICVAIGGFKIHRLMCLTPEDAINSYFDKIDMASAVASSINIESDEYGKEAAKIILDAIDYKILSVDENEASAVAIVEVEAIDMDKIMKEILSSSKAKKADTPEETGKAIFDVIKKNKNKTIKDTITLELYKEDKKWVLKTTNELDNAIMGSFK